MPSPEVHALSGRARGLARLFVRFADEVLRLKELGAGWPLDQPAPEGAGSGAELARRAASCDWSWWPPRAAVDFLLSPLSGLAPAVAWRLDAQWRGDRSLSPRRVLARIASVARADGNAALAAAMASLEKGRIGAAASKLAAAVEEPAAQASLRAVASIASDLAEERVSYGTDGREALVGAFLAALDAAPASTDGSCPLPRPAEAAPAWDRPIERAFLVAPQPGLDTWTLSASQIESYLECPGKWFALRRLKVGGVDAGLTPMQAGTFSHRVLELWGQGLWGDPDAVASVVETDGGPVPGHCGELPLPPEARQASRAWLARCWDAHLAHQVLSGHRAQDQALTPHSEAELARVLDAAVPDIERAVEFVASFRQVTPAGFEVRFGRDEQGVAPRYAGVPVVGSADLVLRDQEGRLLVVDYKHRDDVAQEYASVGSDQRHVQSLLYAGVLGRAPFCERPAGALFLGIGDPCRLAGLCAGSAAPELPAGDAVQEVSDFSEVCEEAEAAVATRVRALLDGDVDPAPRDAEACRYCPALDCPRRLGPRPERSDDPAAALLPLLHTLAQPGDTGTGLYPLLTGPLFALDDADLLLLATGTCEETGFPQARRLDRGVLAGADGLPAGAMPSPRLSRALAALEPALGRTCLAPLSQTVAAVLAQSPWLGTLDAAGRQRAAYALAFLDAHEASGGGVATAPAAFSAWLERR